jgi:hypothetical protein
LFEEAGLGWLRRNPIAWYIVVFSAVVAWGMTRPAPPVHRASAGVHPAASYATLGEGVATARPEMRRVAQRMLLR